MLWECSETLNQESSNSGYLRNGRGVGGGYRYRAELWGMKSFSRVSPGCAQPQWSYRILSSLLILGARGDRGEDRPSPKEGCW